MTRYYCSGFDTNDIFGHGLGNMIKDELTNTKSIVYIPGSPKDEEKLEKAEKKYIPNFRKCFENVGIQFDREIFIRPDTNPQIAQESIKNANFIMLMGGNPFDQKEMCEKLGLLSLLKIFDGVLMGFSAGAMLMSKYIIITPCSKKYPNFRVEDGLNLDELSIYPHNNTSLEEYPNTLVVEDETYRKSDLLKVAQQYGEYYLLQDNFNGNNWDISIIKSKNGTIEFYRENDGKIWIVGNDVVLINRYTTRKYNDEDYEFVYQLKKDSYIKYVEANWGTWNEEDQRKYFEKFINTVKNDSLIICDGQKRIGFYNGEQLDEYTYEVGNICIIPEYQGKGIGTKLLKGILEEHKEEDVKIQYFKQNPVGKLYERLGFIPSGETDYHYQMIKETTKHKSL